MNAMTWQLNKLNRNTVNVCDPLLKIVVDLVIMWLSIIKLETPLAVPLVGNLHILMTSDQDQIVAYIKKHIILVERIISTCHTLAFLFRSSKPMLGPCHFLFKFQTSGHELHKQSNQDVVIKPKVLLAQQKQHEKGTNDVICKPNNCIINLILKIIII